MLKYLIISTIDYIFIFVNRSSTRKKIVDIIICYIVYLFANTYSNLSDICNYKLRRKIWQIPFWDIGKRIRLNS